jgi:serine/threonine-protein kinase
MVMKPFFRDKVYSPMDRIGEYTLLKVIGEGRYGICYLAARDRNKYIVKQLKRVAVRKSKKSADFEEEILGSVTHERIPQFITRISTTKFKGYVLEYKEGKTFEELIYTEKRTFQRDEIQSIGHQIIQILKYLHSRGVVHRDIRVPNIIYHEERVHVVDFGLSRWIDNNTYSADMDFSFLGDFLLHLYYTSYEGDTSKSKPWYEELRLTDLEMILLKRLLGIKDRYRYIDEVENDFRTLIA